VVVAADGHQRVGVAIEERFQHLPVVGVEGGAVGWIDVHDELHRLGDVPRRFEHVDEAVHSGRPGEADVSIRPGWFHHPAEDRRVKSADELVRLYLTSVGRNAKLLLNVPPTRAGLLHAEDLSSLTSMRAGLNATFQEDVEDGRKVTWKSTSPSSATAELDLGRPAAVSLIDLREPIEFGQLVARYSVEIMTDAGWQAISQGTTIGCRRIAQLPSAVTARRVRLVIHETLETPRQVHIGLYS